MNEPRFVKGVTPKGRASMVSLAVDVKVIWTPACIFRSWFCI
jgi:hypothetical protein